MGILARVLDSPLFQRPLLKEYTALVREDLRATYSRDIQKWLLVAPIIGIITGLVIAGITILILGKIWAALLPLYLAHHWMILPGLLLGFLATGLIMQFRTPDPDEHSTEEIIRSYHEHQGDIDFKPFWWKLLAAVTTVGSGGSAALEGPSIYGGGAIGSWLWTKLRRYARLESRDRRIMLISGAAAGMAAVFRAPLTGIVFALEMPYKDDLAHEALLPSLISSVVAYATLVAIVGAEPLFGFHATTVFHSADVIWSAILGAGIGLIAIVFDITFRRVAYLLRPQPRSAYVQTAGGRIRHRDLRARLRDDFSRQADSDRPQLRSRALRAEHALSVAPADHLCDFEARRHDLLARLGRGERDVRAAAAGRGMPG